MRYRNPLSPPQFPARWASSSGEDSYGLWMKFTYQGATLTFRWIQPGTFMMGSPDDEIGRRSCEDHHEVTLEQGFWLSDTQITQAFFQAVSGANPSQFKGEQLPVETVSWDESLRFIQRLNQLHLDLRVRLPREVEWEYACRAGTTHPFSFGNEISLAKANYRGVWAVKEKESYSEGKEWGEGAPKQTTNVKSHSANVWGLYGMHGNVWEWCQDEWQESLGAESRVFSPSSLKREGGVKGKQQEAVEEFGMPKQRVIRGGSWGYDGRFCRSADRGKSMPGYRGNTLGFRLALSALSFKSGQAIRAS